MLTRRVSLRSSLSWMKHSTRFISSSQPNFQASKDVEKAEAPRPRAPSDRVTEEGLPKRKPFVKELLLGKFDTDVLTFPEILDKDRYETLHDMVGPIEKFFREEVDSKQIDADGKIPEKVLQGLKELGLFGQQVPEEYGGLGLGATEYARLQEIISADGGIAVTLAAHQAIGYKGVLLYGNEAQKEKYLPRLASGEWTAAFALTEPNAGSDAGSVSTKAVLSQDGKSWILNGSKIWISNGGTADFFTVFAKTADDVVSEKSSKRVTAFIVERSFKGVSSGKAEDKMGIRGSNTSEVYFDNVVVPAENVLGEVGDGFKIAVNILNSGRFSMGSAVAGGLRQRLAMAAEYAINRKQFGRPLMDFALIKEKFARTAMSIYAMESMSYLTAGMLDSGEYENCAVEAAIVKVYSSEAAWNCGSELLQVFGGSGYMKDLEYERSLRDSRILLIFEGTNEILRLFIALMSLQHTGVELKDVVKKLRNPFMNPGFVLEQAWKRYKNQRGDPKLSIGLQSFLHPSLGEAAKQLEFAVHRLSYAAEIVLQKHGKKVTDPENQMELRRLADCLIDIYAMTAVLARASRSYCIGQREAETEIILALAFVKEASDRCAVRVNELAEAGVQPVTVDKQLMSVADQVFKNKGYFAEHPLSRTYW